MHSGMYHSVVSNCQVNHNCWCWAKRSALTFSKGCSDMLMSSTSMQGKRGGAFSYPNLLVISWDHSTLEYVESVLSNRYRVPPWSKCTGTFWAVSTGLWLTCLTFDPKCTGTFWAVSNVSHFWRVSLLTQNVLVHFGRSRMCLTFDPKCTGTFWVVSTGLWLACWLAVRVLYICTRHWGFQHTLSVC